MCEGVLTPVTAATFLNLNYHCELMSILSRQWWLIFLDRMGGMEQNGGGEVWSGISICIQVILEFSLWWQEYRIWQTFTVHQDWQIHAQNHTHRTLSLCVSLSLSFKSHQLIPSFLSSHFSTFFSLFFWGLLSSDCTTRLSYLSSHLLPPLFSCLPLR